MIVTGMNIEEKDLNFCPKCGRDMAKGRKGKYPEQYRECSVCYVKIELGLDGRDW